MVRFATAALLLAVTSVVVVGCHSGGSGSVTVATPVDFVYEAQFISETAQEVYFWNSPFDFAFVEIEAFGLLGEFTVEVFDAEDRLIYSEKHFGLGDDQISVGETGLGVPGEWVIVISTFDAWGKVEVEVY